MSFHTTKLTSRVAVQSKLYSTTQLFFTPTSERLDSLERSQATSISKFLKIIPLARYHQGRRFSFPSWKPRSGAEGLVENIHIL